MMRNADKIAKLVKKELQDVCGKIKVRVHYDEKMTKSEIQMLNFYGGACYIHEGDDQIIHIHNDMEKFIGPAKFAEGHDYRVREFVESIGLDYNRPVKFLFVLLHEFGHAYVRNLFFSNEMVPEYTALDYEDQARHLMYSSTGMEEARYIWNKELNIALPQFVRAIEAQADIFAMKKFLPMWNKIEDLI
jgi:hypothetical protein